MIPIHIELQAIRERQHELWREADAFRCRRTARMGQSRWRNRVCRVAGGWLMAWGTRLQQLAAELDVPSRPAATAHGSSH